MAVQSGQSNEYQSARTPGAFSPHVESFDMSTQLQMISVALPTQAGSARSSSIVPAAVLSSAGVRMHCWHSSRISGEAMPAHSAHAQLYVPTADLYGLSVTQSTHSSTSNASVVSAPSSLKQLVQPQASDTLMFSTHA
eukprot:363988-Chlamydomonas_euryale.AAC.6